MMSWPSIWTPGHIWRGYVMFLQLTAKEGFNWRADCYLLPLRQQREGFLLAYGAPLAGHNGMEATVACVATYFWWPTVQRDVRLMVQNCPDCVQKITKERLKRPVSMFHPAKGTPSRSCTLTWLGPCRRPWQGTHIS